MIFQNDYYNAKDKCQAMRKQREGDWVCRFCSNLNYGFRNICNRCKKQTKENNYQQCLYQFWDLIFNTNHQCQTYQNSNCNQKQIQKNKQFFPSVLLLTLTEDDINKTNEQDKNSCNQRYQQNQQNQSHSQNGLEQQFIHSIYSLLEIR